MGIAERMVRICHPYAGIINIAVRYSKILPNDQNNEITMTIVARVVDGKYSSIRVDLNNGCDFLFESFLSISYP